MCDDCGPRLRALAAPLCARCGAPTALAVSACRALLAPALVHDGALGALARRARARPRLALEARRDLAGAAGGRARRPRAAAAARSTRSRSCPRCATARSLRGADPPAELAAELGRWWELPGRRRSCAARAASDRSGASTRARAGATCAARSRRARAPRSLALVDDVYTTGATVDECARALRQAGAEQVHVITLARTPLDRSFARAPPRGRLRATTYPSGEARDAASGRAAGTWMSPSRFASTRFASWRASSAT